MTLPERAAAAIARLRLPYLPGMAIAHPSIPHTRWRRVSDSWVLDGPGDVSIRLLADALLDLDDPLTVQGLLLLVRRAWRSPHAHTVQRGSILVSGTPEDLDAVYAPAWGVDDVYADAEMAAALGSTNPRPGRVGIWGYRSEVEALINTLESVPTP